MITVNNFGENVKRYTITNAKGASVSFLDLGGTVTSLLVPDRNGKLTDVVLGFDTLASYLPENDGNLGSLIGRHGNRIGMGDAVIGGVHYQLEQNDNGVNNLHSGKSGFQTRMFAAKVLEEQNAVELTVSCADGDGGFPGKLDVKVTYSLDDEGAFTLHYEAVSDKDTICNLTNHTYFNLNGEGSGVIDGHKIMIDADRITEVDDLLIPNGKTPDVTGTAFDLRKSVSVGEGFAKIDAEPQMKLAGGYDHNFCLNGEGMRKSVVVEGDQTGITMEVWTDLPGVQFYTANMLTRTDIAKCGKPYGVHQGFCLETQVWPDSVHHDNFPQCILKAGEKYDTVTKYIFK